VQRKQTSDSLQYRSIFVYGIFIKKLLGKSVTRTAKFVFRVGLKVAFVPWSRPRSAEKYRSCVAVMVDV